MRHLRKFAAAVLVVFVVLTMNFSSALAAEKPNILVVWGDDIGQSNISQYTHGMMGYKTPNIDRIAQEGMTFTDYYGEQSCTAGRSSFIMGQSVFRTGLSTVGLPGAKEGMHEKDPTIAGLLKAQGYATGQFGKNHLGDRDEMLPTNHGFDEFLGNLYHLNAEEEPENEDYPKESEYPNFKKRFGPRQPYLGEAGAEYALAHDERRAACSAALFTVVVGKGDALLGDAVEVGRHVTHHSMGVVGNIGLADIVTPDDKDIGLFGSKC